jgi:heat-inducible transcriptional repressor
MPSTSRTKPTGPDLDERSLTLFRTLVERYIRSGQPVGSRTLSKDTGSELSPATIRNVMADLEDLGLLRAPHTSAGRVPTALGFRLFVDTLLSVAPLDEVVVAQLRRELEEGSERKDLVEVASSLLSDVTHLAGIVTLPKHEEAKLRQVEFLSLSEDQVLVILVVNNREVQNRIIHTGRCYSQAELQRAASYLNELCGGRDLRAVRTRLLDELREHRESMNLMMRAAIDMADKVFATTETGDEGFVVAGQTNLMGYGELGDMDKLRELFEAFSRKRDILHLLDQSLTASGVQIFIGEESGYEPLDGCSVVTAPYEDNGNVVGVLGVIGPTRMAYDRVIPIVDITARLVGATLNRRH